MVAWRVKLPFAKQAKGTQSHSQLFNIPFLILNQKSILCLSTLACKMKAVDDQEWVKCSRLTGTHRKPIWGLVLCGKHRVTWRLAWLCFLFMPCQFEQWLSGLATETLMSDTDVSKIWFVRCPSFFLIEILLAIVSPHVYSTFDANDLTYLPFDHMG